MATTDQTLLGLRENIFKRLEDADYLVFIDFRREEIKLNSGDSIHRGSLFSNQELAIASFLEIPALILQENGVKQLDGMLGALQANAKGFSDRSCLPDVVSGLLGEKLRSGEWQNQTRNMLSLEIADPPYTDARQTNHFMRRFYHIAVHNHHHKKAALYCYAHLDAILNLGTNKKTQLKTIEIKWAGTTLSGVRIGPNSVREFDAINFYLHSPIQPIFWPITDSPEYYPRLDGSGNYLLNFSVVSQNFGTTTKGFVFEYGASPETVKISTD